MSINLDENRTSMIREWKDVLDNKTDTNWALFGYEGQTNVLKFVAKGSGGLEELAEDLNSGKIMYAFAKVNDSKTSLDKCVLINWQGEGANVVRKGMCANHLRDVEKFFRGAHLTVNARNDEEVEQDLILDKIAKSGSAYCFNAPREETIETSGPVGTTYQKINPVKEINSKERDRFWRKEEEEEKRRISEEQRKRESEQKRLETESQQRENQETAKREAQNLQRDHNIDEIKESQRVLVESHKDNYDHTDISPTRQFNPSDVLRKQRTQEAHDLIAQRTVDAKSIFEKNTASGQVKRIPEKPVRNSILKAQNEAKTATYAQKEEQSDEEADQFSTIKRSPRDVEKKPVVTSASTEKIAVPEEPVTQITDQQFVDEYIYGFTTTGLTARALYDYQAADGTEITFDPGDVITNIDQVDEGWWQGLAPDGSYGLFPANYVELIE